MKKEKKVSPRFLTALERKYLYIRKQYERLEFFVENKTTKAEHPADDAPYYEYGGLYNLLSIKQPESQERMEASCTQIENENNNEPSEKCAVIRFDRNILSFGGEGYSLGCGVCELKTSSGISDCFDINVDTRLKLTIYISLIGAYMKAESDHGDVYYFQLSEFRMLHREIEESGVPCTGQGECPVVETGVGAYIVYDRSERISYACEVNFNEGSVVESMPCEEGSENVKATADAKEEASD